MGRELFFFLTPSNIKESGISASRDLLKVLICPLCFTFLFIPSPSLHSIFKAGCFSVYHNHAKIFLRWRERSHLLPFSPWGLPFSHIHSYHFKQHILGLFLPGMMISWHNTPGMERGVFILGDCGLERSAVHLFAIERTHQ